MDTALAQKFPFILDRNLAKANCTENHVCTSCDTVVLGTCINILINVNNAVFLAVVANAWLETLLDVIDLLPKDIIKDEVSIYKKSA